MQQKRDNKKITDEEQEEMDKKTVKKLWMNIAKKEIPRIFKYFDKVRNDNQQNTSKYVQACSKEERKKV